ncbi:MAG TPA: hypothetical protein VKT80_07140 [Chloroflexota bacterium]|nr:hypothetical protein [Chloroflexota bacterium]
MRGNPRTLSAALVLAVGLTILLYVHLASAGPAVNTSNTTIIHGVQWANVTDTGFTVAWVTDIPIPGSGSVIYGLTPSTVFTSVRESSPPPGARGDVHVVQVSSLTASTNYFVAVAAGGTQDNNGGLYYEIKTGPPLTPLANPGTVYGSVTLAGGHGPASGVLVSLKVLDNTNRNGSESTTSATLAAETSGAGTWSLVLNPRTSDYNSVFGYSTDGTTDFVQYTVDAGALGDGGIQTIPLLLDGSGHLTVPTISVSVPAATDTPSVTSTGTVTPTSTATQTMTRTPMTTSTATVSSPVDNPSDFGTPIDTPVPPVPTEVPTPALAPQTMVERAPAIVDQLPTPAPPVTLLQPTPVPIPRPVTFAPTPTTTIGPPVAASPPATQVIASAPASPATPDAAPRFPFGGTPIALAEDASQTTPGPLQTPSITVTSLITPSVRDQSAPARPAVTSDGLPPVAALLLAVGLAAAGLGIAVVTIEVSRQLRNS